MRLSVMHNLYFYNTLTRRIRDNLDAGTFGDFRAEYSQKLGGKNIKRKIIQKSCRADLKCCPKHDIINEIQIWRKDHVPFLKRSGFHPVQQAAARP